MKIIHVATECAPVAKVGGLGDVVYGLSRAFVALGHDILVIIPRYGCLREDLIDNFHLAHKGEDFDVWTGEVDGVPVYFLDIPDSFAEGLIYGGKDDPRDFIRFSTAAYQWICRFHNDVDVIHLHDWPVAPLVLHARGQHKVCGTIHNIAHQGVVKQSLVWKEGINPKNYPEVCSGFFFRRFHLLKALITYSDAVNTVSPTYAWEVMHTKKGCGLDQALKDRGDRFIGILNGVDDAYWNPKTDPYLTYKYDIKTLDSKAKLKSELRQRLGLANTHKPIIGVVTRLVHQKGLPLIEHALKSFRRYNAQVIVHGLASDDKTLARYTKLQDELSKTDDARIFLGFDEAFAHKVYGGADLLLVPSLFEPCGLTQLIALRYGTLPIVRKTGGLADTVFDVTYSGKPFSECNGFTFVEPTPAAMDKAIERAVALWRESPEQWFQLQEHAMGKDYSWRHSAQQYLDLYYAL